MPIRRVTKNSVPLSLSLGLLLLLSCAPDEPVGLSDEQFVRNLTIVDLHNDRSFFLTAKHVDWPQCAGMNLCASRYSNAHFVFSIWRPPTPVRAGPPWALSREQAIGLNEQTPFAYIQRAIGELRTRTNLPVSNHSEQLRHRSESLLLGVEGAFLLSNSENGAPPSVTELGAMLQRLRADGVLYVGLAWSNFNPYAGTAGQSRGLKPAGDELVRLLIANRLLIDLSHTSDQTVRDLYAGTGGAYPLFFSHSSVRALCGHDRNLSDELIRLVAASGGLIGINFYTRYLNCSGEATAEDLFRHIEHIRNLIGVDIIAFGSDYDGFAAVPPELRTPDDLRRFALRLLAAGYTRSEVEQIYSGNAISFLERWESNTAQFRRESD
ncbi:MAG: membrane dipeptidase [Spirochaetales bacterium]|nr:membrane dipeptidase [Leptospiraceae bacterium]MCP5480974.1 membrane dipeptidase [Spirochaetales bacterium]MCP5485354.1 membrane dipeptidase [Spirochaetales bacterium]